VFLYVLIDMNDVELLRSFRESRSEEAFREMVNRHLGMVYAVALRQMRKPELAEEVAHAVFIALARKADALSDRTILAGWLYRATRFAASKLLRDEERRVRHEKEAAMEYFNNSPAEPDEAAWIELSPLVFETLDSLSRRDRDAILLRFVENRSFAEVGAALGATEAAAKMRTTRALDKLRKRLSKRGVAVAAASLATGLVSAQVHALPPNLGVLINSVVLGHSTPTASAVSLAGAILSALKWAQLKIATVCAGILVLALGIAGFAITQNAGIGSFVAQPNDVVRRNGWIVDGRNVRSEVHRGQVAIDFDSQPDRGIAWRKGTSLSEGVIEVDIAALTGHMGVAFWVQDSQHYSAIYFRPQNRPEDPVNGGHGVQYVALPQYSWERLRGEKPGTYENSVSLPAADSGLWFHVRIEVSPAQVRAFVNGSTMPCLVVNNLLTTNTTGSVGVFMGTGSPGIFSNLKAKSVRK
jgi:RNA polymerase sigma factor (sigma-70 family)